MTHLFLLVAVMLAGVRLSPQQQGAPPPSTDVYLATITASGGTITIEKPENISQSAGYDNQPSFTTDGTGIFFTSDRESKTGTTGSQMDIFRFDVKTRSVSRVTATPESEYSATVTPDRKHISVIRVEADGTQRLWKFPLKGENPSLVLENVKPVGYHAWLNANYVAMFVLGQPATLQLADVRTGATTVIASGIGRSLQKMPGGGVSFVKQEGRGAERQLVVTELVLERGRPVTRALIPAVAGAREADLAWMPDGTLLMAHDGSLYAWKKGETEWRVIADLGALGLKDVSRLAISPKGDRIALVAAQ